MCGSENN